MRDRDIEYDRGTREEAPRPPEAEPVMLELQRAVGNHAVSRMLARQPSPTAPPKEDRAATMTAGLGEEIGVIPIDSFGWGAQNPGSVGSPESSVHEVSISFEPNAAASMISLYASEGRPIPKAFISTQKVTIDFSDVILSGYQQSGEGEGRGGTITVTLNFKGMKLRPVP